LGSIWAGVPRASGFLLIGIGLAYWGGLALGNPTPMRRRADGTNALVEVRISGWCALHPFSADIALKGHGRHGARMS
jgi:hypothetical protein